MQKPDKDKSKDKHPRQARRLADSDRILASRAARRKGEVLIVTGVGKPEYKILMPAQLEKLRVDESYQRIRITSEVNELIHVLKAGGDVPDPITVARRPNGDLFIVDGQQRFWAHWETGTPLKCLIYDVDSVESEKRLYIASNNRVKVGNNYMVKAWSGIGAETLRKMSESDGNPIEGVIDFGVSKMRPFAASTAIRVMAVAAIGGVNAGSGQIQKVLTRLDYELERNATALARSQAILVLVSDIFGVRERIPLLPCVAIARVAFRRWNGRPKPVDPAVISRISKMKWGAVVDSMRARYLPVLEAEIERRWKE